MFIPQDASSMYVIFQHYAWKGEDNYRKIFFAWFKFQVGNFNFWVSEIFELTIVNPLSANFTKWSNTLKQFVGKVPTNCLSVFDHFVGLVHKGLRKRHKINYKYKKYKYPNLLLIRICELKSEKLSHSQRAFSRFLRRIPHKLFCINYSV